MAQAILDKVINELNTLQSEELDQLEQAIQERRSASEMASKEAIYHQALLASGLVKRIARRTEPDTSERRLAEAQGEPASETILRERR